MARSLEPTRRRLRNCGRQRTEPDQSRWREVDDGILVADHWDSLDTAGRAKFLRDWESSCFADRDGAGTRSAGWRSTARRSSLREGRLCPAALPAVITTLEEWQAVPGAVLPARVASPSARA